jgi:hypothetical protein
LHIIAPLTRWVGYGLAARLSGKFDFEKNANYWGAVWRRRGEWMNGYDTHVLDRK